MGNYGQLKAAINAVIKTNGNEEITGAILQSILNTVVSTVGANSQFAGIATTTTVPGTPDGNVYYLASSPGTYANFGGIIVYDGEVAIIANNGANWVKTSSGMASNLIQIIIAMGYMKSPMKYIYTNISGEALNGAIKDDALRKITIPIGVTGQSAYMHFIFGNSITDNINSDLTAGGKVRALLKVKFNESEPATMAYQMSGANWTGVNNRIICKYVIGGYVYILIETSVTTTNTNPLRLYAMYTGTEVRTTQLEFTLVDYCVWSFNEILQKTLETAALNTIIAAYLTANKYMKNDLLEEGLIYNRMLSKIDSPLVLRTTTFTGEALNGATINLTAKTITVPANMVGNSSYIQPMFDGYSTQIQALNEGYIYSAMMFRCTRATDGIQANFSFNLRSQSAGTNISTWNRFFVHPNDPNVFFAISRTDKTKLTGVTGLRFPLQLGTIPTATTDRVFTILDTVVYFDTQSRTEIEVEKLMLDSIIGNSAALTTKINAAVTNSLGGITKLITTAANQFINYNVTGITDWVYGVGVYFGYNKPVLKDCLLDSITMSLFNVTTSHIGNVRQFVIGTVDQRNWLLPRLIVDCPISAVTSGNATFDFMALKIIMNAGEVVFAVSAPIGANASLGLNTSSYDANNKLLTTDSLTNALVAKTTTNANVFQLNVLDIDSVFATKGSIDAVNSKILALTDKTAKINLYNDYITGDKYELKIVNGAVVVQSLEFKRILVIGHSFVNYSNSPTVDWNLDDGENRAMAASVNAHQWTTFVKNVFGATLTLQSGVDFERYFSPTYNFATNWNVANNYDAICIYLQENAVYSGTMQASWEAMLNYLKTAAPNAKIYCTGSWSANTKQQAIQAACNAVADITYVDLVGLNTANNQWKRGDYYFGRASTYYPMGAPNTHPNDMGHLTIANYFLLYMGQNQITNNSHTITLNQATGGTIETPNTTWVENGIVTIRINPTSGYAINGLNVVTAGGQAVTVTQRTNNFYDGTNRVYYTFTMPAKNVVVTPTWATI